MGIPIEAQGRRGDIDAGILLGNQMVPGQDPVHGVDEAIATWLGVGGISLFLPILFVFLDSVFDPHLGNRSNR